MEQDKSQSSLTDKDKELRKGIAEIISDEYIEMKKKEREDFVNRFDPLMEKIDAVAEKGEEQNIEIKLSMFRHKMALITFNGALLALMVSSNDKISFGLVTFSLLFFSILAGVAHIIYYYFSTEYEFIKGINLHKKLKAISNLCKEKDSVEIVEDTKAFLRQVVLSDKTNYENVPALVHDIDKKYNVNKTFIKTLIAELFFYLPFVSGIGLVIYKLFSYIEQTGL